MLCPACGISLFAGYLHSFCKLLHNNLDNLPGDERLSIGFITVDSTVQFWRFTSTKAAPEQLIVDDVDGELLFLRHFTQVCSLCRHLRTYLR